MRKLITIFIALLIVLPIFGLVGVSSVEAIAEGDDCGSCDNLASECLADGQFCCGSTSCPSGKGPCVSPATDHCDSGFECSPSTFTCVAVAAGGLDVWGEEYGVGEAKVGTLTGLGSQDPRQVAAKVINIILGFLGIIAVILILVGGFMWMTAAGNEDKVGTAKKLMTAGVVGLIIVLAAFGIAKFVVNALIGATK